jgi:hypothetical protein
MRKLHNVSFGLSLIGAAITGLLAVPSDTPTSGAARIVFPVFCVLAIGLFLLRRRAQANEGLGFMKPGTTRLSEFERTRAHAEIIRVAHDALKYIRKPSSTEPMTKDIVIVSQEIQRLSALWRAANPHRNQSDAETQSLYLLQTYALSTSPQAKREELLANVADPAPFRALRCRVEEATAARAARAVPTEKVTDMSHLLKDGWTAFLQGMPHPDPVLWHGVATDFHGIEKNGRLDAAFWLLGQPECDRATASDFIRGFVAYELFETAARSGDTARLNAFQTVVQRYNAGFYEWFGIVPDAGGIEPIAETVEGDFDDTAVAAMMRRIAAARGMNPVTVPVGLLSFKTRPTNPMPGLVRSPYEFWEDAGLHTRETIRPE